MQATPPPSAVAKATYSGGGSGALNQTVIWTFFGGKLGNSFANRCV
jgi:hypothetical protein